MFCLISYDLNANISNTHDAGVENIQSPEISELVLINYEKHYPSTIYLLNLNRL